MSVYKKSIEPHLEMIFSHLVSGGSMEDLMLKLNVKQSEFDSSMRRSRVLAETVENALKIRRDKDDSAVENALFQRAVGFEQPDGKFAAPDVRAAIFWLKNRRPQEWDEKKEIVSPNRIKLSELEEEL